MTTDTGNDYGPDTGLFEKWVNKNYGGNTRTKTVTKEKYTNICRLIRGDDPNCNAKFRFWVRNKGFRLIRHDEVTHEIVDDPNGDLYVSLHAKQESAPMGECSIEKFLRTNLPAISFFRKVAVVEEFYGIIKRAHVDEKGQHAGQKKTYRLVSDTYAFLPREVITFYLLNCDTCKPRIQKYGPVPSEQNGNKGGARENGSKTNEVIRPSPKRYQQTYNRKMQSEVVTHLIPTDAEEQPVVHILDDAIFPGHKLDSIRKMDTLNNNISDIRTFPKIPSERNYWLEAGHISPSYAERIPHLPPKRDVAVEMRPVMNERDHHESFDKVPRNLTHSFFPYHLEKTNHFHDRYRRSIADFEQIRSRRFYGSRMQPYQILPREDRCNIYQRHHKELGPKIEVVHPSYEVKNYPLVPLTAHQIYEPAQSLDSQVFHKNDYSASSNDRKFNRQYMTTQSSYPEKKNFIKKGEISLSEKSDSISVSPSSTSNFSNKSSEDKFSDLYLHESNILTGIHQLVYEKVTSSLGSLYEGTELSVDIKVPEPSTILDLFERYFDSSNDDDDFMVSENEVYSTFN